MSDTYYLSISCVNRDGVFVTKKDIVEVKKFNAFDKDLYIDKDGTIYGQHSLEVYIIKKTRKEVIEEIIRQIREFYGGDME